MMNHEMHMLKKQLYRCTCHGPVAWDDLYVYAMNYYYNLRIRHKCSEEDFILTYDEFLEVMFSIVCDKLDMDHVTIGD